MLVKVNFGEHDSKFQFTYLLPDPLLGVAKQRYKGNVLHLKVK